MVKYFGCFYIYLLWQFLFAFMCIYSNEWLFMSIYSNAWLFMLIYFHCMLKVRKKTNNLGHIA